MDQRSESVLGEIESPLGTGKAVVILDRRLARAKRISVALTVAIPALATAYALVIAAIEGVSWLDIALFLIFYFATLFGVTVGFHRLLAHRAFTAGRWTKVGLAVCGTCAAQGPVLDWAGTHRRHHTTSDRDGDPHSPNLSGDGAWGRLKGLFYAHFLSVFAAEVTNYPRFAPDLMRDEDLAWINKHYFSIILAGLALPAAIGGLATLSLEGAWTALLWGGFVRMFVVHHAILSITSIAHVFGVKKFRTGDESRDSYMLALFTGGEGWHNTHHAFPNAAILTTSYWQIDISGMAVWGLERCGMARGVVRISLASRKAKSLT